MAQIPVQTEQRPTTIALRIGWTLSGIIAIFIGSSGVNSLRAAPFVVARLTRFGYSPSVVPALGAAELLCVTLFLIPRTAALGTILLTAFLGGAVATHVRVGDPGWPVPILVAVVVWVALILRDPRFHIIRPSRDKA